MSLSQATVDRVAVSPIAAPGVLTDGDRALVSVLVPAKDEAENLPLFMELAAAAFADQPGRYEVIVVDDGSTDDTWQVLENLVGRYPFLRAVRHRQRRARLDRDGRC